MCIWRNIEDHNIIFVPLFYFYNMIYKHHSAHRLKPSPRVPQQLLRETDHLHPDRYYIEACLTGLEDFLECLNGSIEQSVATVTGGVPSTAMNSQPKRNKRSYITSF